MLHVFQALLVFKHYIEIQKINRNCDLIYFLHFSQPLNHTVEIYFNYAFGEKSEVSYHQNSPIISPLPNVTAEAGTKEIPLKITGLRAGSLSIGLNSSSDDFAE